jgi:hypothetical protein
MALGNLASNDLHTASRGSDRELRRSVALRAKTVLRTQTHERGGPEGQDRAEGLGDIG